MSALAGVCVCVCVCVCHVVTPSLHTAAAQFLCFNQITNGFCGSFSQSATSAAGCCVGFRTAAFAEGPNGRCISCEDFISK